NLAMGQPGTAFQLDNIFPTANGGILRRGHVLHAQVSAGATVKALFNYTSGSANTLFAANDAGIWNVTTAETVENLYEVTEGRISLAQYTNTDGVRYIR